MTPDDLALFEPLLPSDEEEITVTGGYLDRTGYLPLDLLADIDEAIAEERRARL